VNRTAVPPLTCSDVQENTAGDPAQRAVRKGSGRTLVGLIHLYQSARSGRPTGCRFIPSCSEYAVEAIQVHGAAHGSVLAARRIARCTPWGGHGVDPVPDRRAP